MYRLRDIRQMNAGSTIELRKRTEKARAARKFAHQSMQRAAVLIAQAELLRERFDQLERRVLLKESHIRRSTATGDALNRFQDQGSTVDFYTLGLIVPAALRA